ncbi:phosphoadenylyl-sulfate reductase [Brevundimonas variabilis]|uniref:Adenosine 5'-phosphosulfate reductase n=1 Tax=Brevundimonas variabilis TaxID=74312 RepID=A0A7W9CIW5_9CAUL|nr:phosphoadenylyl-sulfate reductase [Brevundimonas variabilis]MBB5746223.1 phosphoadenylyl-sulfate reductase (thioredoxin) [Brevundimonas variabilis]
MTNLSLRFLDTPPLARGLRLDVTTPLAEVRSLSKGEAALVLVFGTFRDGRGFSVASALRAGGFEGQLIAAGAVLPDQARHLARSGFDAVELPAGTDLETWTRMLSAFDVPMQVAERGSQPAWNRRGRVPRPSLNQIASTLNAGFAEADPATLIRAAMNPAWGLKIATLSSFGAEASVILDFVAQIDPALPVLFLDTGQHFLQTLSYRKQLSAHLGLMDVRIILPDADDRAERDARDDLWRTDPDACCDIRKVAPLGRASAPFDVLITGRKRHHRGDRTSLPLAEVIDGTLRLNPLAAWSMADVEGHVAKRELPAHPLVEQGYASIGCWPCTRPPVDKSNIRSGRWAESDKRECGIHLPKSTRVTAG